MDSWLLTVLVLSIAVFIRLAISLHPYSGAGKPPMFGDYEAQRHWMEITYHTPLKEWYHSTLRNNLTYWGLDYPPLTAYHSWLCGVVSHHLNSSWVALGSSHGLESYEHKLFMRYSVLVADLLVFVTGVVAFVRVLWAHTLQGRESNTEDGAMLRSKLSLLILLQPGLLLIDYGHFQYNCVSLGLTLWATVGIMSNYNTLGAIAFTLALNYKQMELYHALPFFFYLLGNSFITKSHSKEATGVESKNSTVSIFRGGTSVLKYGIIVAGTFCVLWFPFYSSGGREGVLQLVRRLFPFKRGLYEDKVANFWCSISVLVKVRRLFSQGTLIVISVLLTLLGAMPSSLYLMKQPRAHTFLLSLVTSSLSFFLFSFQVHEKSILLACVPVSLLSAYYPFLVTTFQLTAVFSMYPLFTQDQLCLAVWAMACLFSLISVLFLDQTGPPLYSSKVKPLVLVLLTVLLILCGLSHIVPSPRRLPHIFPVLISCVSFLLFLFYLVYFTLVTVATPTRPLPSGITGFKHYWRHTNKHHRD